MGSNKVLAVDIEYTVEQCRELHTLPKLMPSIRQCLRCDAQFDSAGNHNRICPYCKIDFLTIPTGIQEDVFKDYRSTLRLKYEWRRRKNVQPT